MYSSAFVLCQPLLPSSSAHSGGFIARRSSSPFPTPPSNSCMSWSLKRSNTTSTNTNIHSLSSTLRATATSASPVQAKFFIDLPVPQDEHDVGGLDLDSYLCLGLAQYYSKIEGGAGKSKPVLVVEPLPSSTIAMILFQDTPTSYIRIRGFRIGDLTQDVKALPQDFIQPNNDNQNPDASPTDMPIMYCDQLQERVVAAARTTKFTKDATTWVPIGTTVQDKLDHSVLKKRFLNEIYEPSFEDNVKQDISIDVYGRK